jgi:hypothetical protein
MTTPYQQGFDAGLAKNTTRRGLMAFGLAFAADNESRANTNQWLEGYKAGEAKANEPRPKSNPTWEYTLNSTRYH